MWIFWITWSLLTCTSALLCLTGCVVPAWLKGSVHVSAQSLQTELLLDLGMNTYGMSSRLGLYRRCVYPVYVQAGPDPRAVTTSSSRAKASGSGRVQNSGPRADLIHLRSTCGHYEFALIPHTAWRIGLTLLVLSSIILVFLSFFLLLSGCYLTVLSLVRVQRTCQVLLLIAGTLAFLCCGIYPLGWNQNSEVQQICGQSSSSFRLGRCQIGWAYLTTLFGAFLAIASAALPSLCVNHMINDETRADTCCKFRFPWPPATSDDTDHPGFKYERGKESGIPMVPMYSGQLDGVSGVGSTMTPCCSPTLTHHPLMGPNTVFLCSSMTPLGQQPFLTQAHSIYSQFTNTSSLGGSSNELGQRPLLTSTKD